MPDITTPGQICYEAMLDLHAASELCDCDTESQAVCVACECRFSLIAAAAGFAFAWHWSHRGLTPPPTWTPERTPPMSNPTPGQVAYEAFMTALALDHPTPWHRQDVRHHAAWEAAAQAVLAMQRPQQEMTHEPA